VDQNLIKEDSDEKEEISSISWQYLSGLNAGSNTLDGCLCTSTSTGASTSACAGTSTATQATSGTL